jgi:hypothetical protein
MGWDSERGFFHASATHDIDDRVGRDAGSCVVRRPAYARVKEEARSRAYAFLCMVDCRFGV